MSISSDLTSKQNYSTINNNTNQGETQIGQHGNKFKEKYLKFIDEYQTYFTAFILGSMNILNITDRYIISSVLIDVQNYFQVSKSTAGLLQTIFLLFYMAFSPLNGYLGDRINRKYLLITSIIIWVISTVSGSLVTQDQFTLFVLSRCLFGVATASFETIAVPIIGDRFFNNHKIRNRVIILFCMGPPLGTGLSYLIGIIAKEIEPTDWRYSMRITPVFLIIILFVILIAYQEPGRGDTAIHEIEPTVNFFEDSGSLHNQPITASGFLDDLKTLFRNRTFVLLNLSWTTGIAALVAFSWWSPTLIDYSLRYQRLPYDIDDLKKAYSLLQTVCGAIGLLIPYKLSTYLKRKSYLEVDCFFLSAGFLASGIFLYIYLVTIKYNAYFTIVIYAFVIISFNLCWVIETSLFLDIIQPNLRSTAKSLMIFILHLIGDSVSPYWVGLIADKCASEEGKNTIHSLLFCSELSNYPLVFLYFLAAAFALFMSFSYKKDKQKAELLID